MTYATLKERRRYCEQTLADPALSPARASIISRKLAQLDRMLAGRCQFCDRPLSLPESVARSAGAVCAGKHGVAA
jgi:Family of unknown function (DUF6011)